MKPNLPDSVSSIQDLQALILEVREYTKWFSHAAILKKMNGKNIPKPPAMSPSTSEMIRTWSNSKPLTRQNLDLLIIGLEKYKHSTENMTIILAAPASGDLKKQLVGWCRKNISADILVSFQFNATILGGMVVRYGSRIFDWSFRRQILASRAKFPGVLKNV